MTWVLLENFMTISSSVGLRMTSSSFMVVLALIPYSLPTRAAQSSMPEVRVQLRRLEGRTSHFLRLSL